MKTFVACLLAVAPVSIFLVVGLQEFLGNREPVFPGHPTAKLSFWAMCVGIGLAVTLNDRNHAAAAIVALVLAAVALIATVLIGLLDHVHRLPKALRTRAERVDVDTWRQMASEAQRETP